MNVKNKKTMRANFEKPGTHVTITPDQLVGEITKRAHEIYLKRGSTPGTPLEDWLKAEREIKAKYRIEQK
jgi:hypothetical protein